MSFRLRPPVSINTPRGLVPRALVATAWWERWSHRSDEWHPDRQAKDQEMDVRPNKTEVMSGAAF